MLDELLEVNLLRFFQVGVEGRYFEDLLEAAPLLAEGDRALAGLLSSDILWRGVQGERVLLADRERQVQLVSDGAQLLLGLEEVVLVPVLARDLFHFVDGVEGFLGAWLREAILIVSLRNGFDKVLDNFEIGRVFLLRVSLRCVDELVVHQLLSHGGVGGKLQLLLNTLVGGVHGVFVGDMGVLYFA